MGAAVLIIVKVQKQPEVLQETAWLYIDVLRQWDVIQL